jgi:hypothetical protein
MMLEAARIMRAVLFGLGLLRLRRPDSVDSVDRADCSVVFVSSDELRTARRVIQAGNSS